MKHSITLSLILLTFYASGQISDKYDKITDSLSKIGQSEKLIPYFQKELKIQPKNELALRWLGYLYISKNEFNLGEKYYREALVVNEKCARCYMNIGRIYAIKKDNRKAFELYDKSIATDPNDALLYSTRANLKGITKDKFGALFDYNKAIELDEKNADYLIQRGNYNSSLGYFSIALSDLNKAVELRSNHYNPYFQRANIYYEQKKFNESLNDMNKAIELDSTQSNLYIGRGAAYAMLNDYVKAAKDYDKAIILNPTDYLPRLNRALDKYRLEDMDGSCIDIYNAYYLIKKSDPDNKDVKTLEESINDYCDSTHASYYYQRGIAYYNLGQYDKAVSIYSGGLKKFPNHCTTLSFRGNAYYAQHDFKNALTDYYLAIQNKDNRIKELKSNPRYINTSNDSINLYLKQFLASIQISIAESKFALAQYEEALIEIDKAIEIAPEIENFGQESYYNVRGNIFFALGKYRQAITDFDKCIQINSNFALGYINRAVAKINLANQIKMTSYYIQGGINNQNFNANWTIPLKATIKKSDANIISALADCNKAIEIDGKFNYAYYFRGQIKKALQYSDYCYDILKAKELGYPLESEQLYDCGIK